MLSFLKDIFTGGAAKLVESVGTAIDSIVTSDEERLALKIAMEKEVNVMSTEQLNAIAKYDSEITDRHKNDMQSDSWLSKNIRPMIIIFLTITTIALAYLTIFLLDTEKVTLLNSWTSLLTTLLVTVYAFYFGSRGAEKSISMIQERKKIKDLQKTKK